jgi:hypothetical protein
MAPFSAAGLGAIKTKINLKQFYLFEICNLMGLEYPW